MKKVITDISLKLIFNSLKSYIAFTMILPFIPRKMKIEKVEKLVANSHAKTEYVFHIRNSKQDLNYGLVLKLVHRVIKFNQKSRLKPYIIMDSERTKKKKLIKKKILTLMSNSVFKK